MASNFAFRPYGLSQMVTVIATAGTVSLNLVKFGGVTQSVTAGNYPPATIRVANLGTVAAFIQLGASADTVTVSTSSGMPVLAQTVETFRLAGQTTLAHISTGTSTLAITTGEGL